MKKMKIIPVRTFGINSKKHNWGITPPMPLGKARKASKKDKRLNYKQARKKYGIKPYGDYDKDGRLNIHDCKPFDPKKHGVYRKYADRPVHSYAVPGLTQEKVFKKA